MLESIAVKSADRVFDIFELLGAWDQQMSHTELCGRLQIPKSSGTQLLRTLVGRGYLKYDSEQKTYSLGPQVRALAERQAEHFDLIGAVRPVLERITAKSCETSALNLLNGDYAVVAATAVAPQILATHLMEGDKVPLYAISGGRAILAFLPAAQRNEYLARVKLEKFTKHSITSRAALKAEIAKIQKTKVSVVKEEYSLGVVGIGMPILNPVGEVLGSLNLALPAARYGDDAFKTGIKILINAIEGLERQISGDDRL